MKTIKLFLMTISLRRSALIGMIALAGLPVAQADVNLINNGTFAGSVNPSSFQTIYAGGASSIPGWTVITPSGASSTGSVDWIGSYWPAVPVDPTSHSVDLDGNSIGGITQTITTVIGNTYKLTFDLNGNFDGPPPTKQVEVTAGNVADQIFSFTPTAAVSTTNYAAETLMFTANSASTAITFTSLFPDPIDPGFWGPVIANVSVTPEPTFYVVLGLGLAGLLSFKAKYKQRA